MGVFSKEERNFALLGKFLLTQGPKTLRKCITDKLFIYQMFRKENTLREHLPADMVLLVFPEGQPVPSLDDLDDLVVPEIGSLAFDLPPNEQDITTLRNSIQCKLEGLVFHEYLQSRKNRFRKRNVKKKLLSKIQFAQLYPESDHPSIFELDITILCFILFEGMDFTPISDFDKLPLESVKSEADDMLRIKICRNSHVHQPVAKISDEDFDAYWECLTGAFERLSKDPRVRRESEELKSLRLSDEQVDKFKAMIQKWRMEDQDERVEHQEQIKYIVAQTGLHVENIIKATGTQIIENQNENYDVLVNLLTRKESESLKVQDKELKKSFPYPLRIQSYEKFKYVCHFMDESGIKYTIHTASSTHTSPNSDSSSSPKSSDDPKFPHFEIDKEWKDIQNSSTDSATNTRTVTDVKQKRLWKRKARAKHMSPQEKSSPRLRSAIRYGIRTNLEDASDAPESADEDPIRQPVLSNGIAGQVPWQLGQFEKSTKDAGDPTGYFLSLLRRDESIHIPSETSIGHSQHNPMEQSLGNINLVLSDTLCLCKDETNMSTYIQRQMQLCSAKKGLCRWDSTGYNTDLISLCQMYGYTSETSLFKPYRQHIPTSIQWNWTEMTSETSEEDDLGFDSSHKDLQNVTDDGYTSDWNFSSLNRSHSMTRHQHQVTDLPDLNFNSGDYSFADKNERGPAVDQAISVAAKSARVSTADISRSFQLVQLSETQRLDRGSQTDNNTDDRGKELKETFV